MTDVILTKALPWVFRGIFFNRMSNWYMFCCGKMVCIFNVFTRRVPGRCVHLNLSGLCYPIALTIVFTKKCHTHANTIPRIAYSNSFICLRPAKKTMCQSHAMRVTHVNLCSKIVTRTWINSIFYSFRIG